MVYLFAGVVGFLIALDYETLDDDDDDDDDVILTWK